MNKQGKKILLKLARKTIINHFKKEKIIEDIPKSLKEKRGIFVTLEKNNQLRGCIGNIYPVKSIYWGVIDNTLNAAFKDSRFSPVSEDEIQDLKIEISILTQQKKLEFKDADDLLKKLNNTDGVIIKKGLYSATFLPQVWEDLPNKEEFLTHLCLKAGLDGDAWKEPGLEVFVYEVEKFGE